MLKGQWRVVLSIDPNEPTRAWLFTLALAAATVLLGFLSEFGPVSWQLWLFAVLLSVAESVPVTMPRNEQNVSVSFAIAYAMVILFPPGWAATAIAIATVVPNLIRKKPLNIWLFNGAQIFLASYASASLWQTLAHDASAGVSLPHDIVPLIAAALLYFVTNTSLTTISISLAYSIPWRTLVVSNVKWAVPNIAVLWTMGLLVIFLIGSDAGLVGVMLLWLPLVVVRYSFRQYVELKQTHIGTIQSLAAALDAKDPYTRGHSQRVADMASKVASALKMPDDEIEAVHYAGLLHDIGKIGVQDDVLNKVGKLTDEDWAKIRSHATIGADIVKQVRFLSGVSEMIRHHHESYDGTGYPAGLKGDQIPLGARILSVCDAYDAMTTERPYRNALSVHEAVTELRRKAGEQFDPHVVEVFLEVVASSEESTGPTLPYTDGTEVLAP